MAGALQTVPAAANFASEKNLNSCSRLDDISIAPPKTVERRTSTGTYLHRWMNNEGEDLLELKQLVGLPQRSLSIAQVWRSTSVSALPHSTSSSIDVDISSNLHVCSVDGEYHLAKKYFNPAYYLNQQGHYGAIEEDDMPTVQIMDVAIEDVTDQDVRMENCLIPRDAKDNIDGNLNEGGEVTDRQVERQTRIVREDVANSKKPENSNTTLDLGHSAYHGKLAGSPNKDAEDTRRGHVVPSASNSAAVALPQLRTSTEGPDGRRNNHIGPESNCSDTKTKRVATGEDSRKAPVPTHSKPLKEYLDEFDKAKGPQETSREGEWRLVTGDLSSPSQGEPAPVKLTIHMRHEDSKCEETLKFTMIK